MCLHHQRNFQSLVSTTRYVSTNLVDTTNIQPVYEELQGLNTGNYRLSLPSSLHKPKKKESLRISQLLQPNCDVNSRKGRRYPKELQRTSVLMELQDQIGILHDVLRFYWKYDINITRIESRPASEGKFDFFIDFEGKTGDNNVDQLLNGLKNFWAIDKLLILDEKEVHWFPRHISELDLIANRVLDAGTDLESDHPGFLDPVYRSRRAELGQLAKEHRWDQSIPQLDYTEKETETWTAVWDKMEGLWDKYACKAYLESLNLMKKKCNYNRTNIPQQSEISTFLESRTNFRMRPVPGLLSSRDFLNGLAFRVFFCTQYIRHPSKPLYTPEPDICHELLGHAPMFANHDFCDFSQEIGLASLGASDEDVTKLARCYWHSVEFGLCCDEEEYSGGDGRMKAYGAGLLSSFGELEHACRQQPTVRSDEVELGDIGNTSTPKILEWNPEVASMQEFPITSYQPVYFLAKSLSDAKRKMRNYCEDLPRPFFTRYNAETRTVYIDRPVKRVKGDIPDNDK